MDTPDDPAKIIPLVAFYLIPTVEQVKFVFDKSKLNVGQLAVADQFTPFGRLLIDYMIYRSEVLQLQVEPNLMNQAEAQIEFYKLKNQLNPSCPLPFNKQTGLKKDYAYLTGIVNMLIWNQIGTLNCDYNPIELTALTENGFPVRVLSRRVDGAFPSAIDPIAIWEVKEYYFTTTFGSRVADGVYETQLDGWELWEARQNLQRNVLHYLMVDAYDTWWKLGRSYLCRLVDSLHMGLVDEVLFGKEVLTRWPILIAEFIQAPRRQVSITEA